MWGFRGIQGGAAVGYGQVTVSHGHTFHIDRLLAMIRNGGLALFRSWQGRH